MKTSRQVERANRFQSALARMPDFETWDLPEIPGTVTIDVVSGKRLPRKNFRLVPRRVRRSMARALAKREHRNARGLV